MHICTKRKTDRSMPPSCSSGKDRQTDRQTDRQMRVCEIESQDFDRCSRTKSQTVSLSLWYLQLNSLHLVFSIFASTWGTFALSELWLAPEGRVSLRRTSDFLCLFLFPERETKTQAWKETGSLKRGRYAGRKQRTNE